MAARITIKAVNDELARLGHQARPGRPHYVALACVLGGGVAGFFAAHLALCAATI